MSRPAPSFSPASRRQVRLHLALIGPAGSGKTYTALKVATHLGKRVALIDTERSSACTYAGDFKFDVCELDDHHPRTYIDAIEAAASAGYEVLIIDSLSHAWAGRGGALELVDKAAARSKGNSSFSAWRDVTPLHNELLDAILSSPCHVIATLRAKMAYTQEQDSKGRTQIRKVGLAPVQRDGVEYEFDIVGDMDTDHNLVITKSRCSQLADAVINRPGEELALELARWVGAAAEAVAPVVEAVPTPASTTLPDALLEAPAVIARRTATARSRETDAERAARQAGHDPGWEADRAAYCAELRRVGLTYDQLAAWCELEGKPRPSRMDAETRLRVLRWLRDAGGAERVLRERGGGQ
jgi:hypothetical protein